MSQRRLTHLDERGRARMVDVSHKPVTARTARAPIWKREESSGGTWVEGAVPAAPGTAAERR